MRIRARLIPGTAVALLLAMLLWSPWESRVVIEVSPGDDVQVELDRAPAGSVILLMPGRHSGGVVIERPLTLRGAPGAAVAGPSEAPAVVSVASEGVAIEGLKVEGGSTGIAVREAQGVVLRDVDVAGSDLHGIEVIDAAALISDVRVGDLQHPMAQGIEVRNSDGRPDTVVEDSKVSGGQEGIVSHVSEVVIRDNRVTQTTMRGITVTEMSDGVVAGNVVTGASGAGLYCGDMSRCEFSDNRVDNVASAAGGRSTEGWGLVVTYHAVASTDGDDLAGQSGTTLASIGGHLREDSPLDPSPLGSAWVPIVVATALAALVLGILYWLAASFATRLQNATARQPSLIKPGGVLPLVVGGLAVQTFHMAEHGLQVFRVRIDQIPSRGGIVGPVVEAEWIHFIYNSGVFLAIGLIVLARARGWRPPGRVKVGDRLMIAGLVVQGYHSVEHTVKLIQHLTGGAKVNPGLAGEFVDLVLFHYAINLTVYLALVGSALFYGLPALVELKRRLFQRRQRSLPRSALQRY